MTSGNGAHLDILRLTVEKLKDLNEDIVYVGGATISIHITQPQVVKIRETFDVDCVVGY